MDSYHPISDLVDAFLEAAQAVAASSDQEISDARPAELTYELDQVVSNYLDAHELSTEHYDAIHQDVVNTIAHHFGDDSSGHASSLTLDEQGNAELTEVITLINQHFSDPGELRHDPLADANAFVVDPSHHGPIG